MSNNYDEVKNSIKNYLKDKITKQYYKTEEDEKDHNANSTRNKNEINIKNNTDQIPVQISNSTISKGLNNLMINSSRTSVESPGNSIDHYIKMENLYLQD